MRDDDWHVYGDWKRDEEKIERQAKIDREQARGEKDGEMSGKPMTFNEMLDYTVSLDVLEIGDDYLLMGKAESLDCKFKVYCNGLEPATMIVDMATGQVWESRYSLERRFDSMVAPFG